MILEPDEPEEPTCQYCSSKNSQIACHPTSPFKVTFTIDPSKIYKSCRSSTSCKLRNEDRGLSPRDRPSYKQILCPPFDQLKPPKLETLYGKCQEKTCSNARSSSSEPLLPCTKDLICGLCNKHTCPHRRYEEENEWGCGNWCEYTLVVVLACLMLLGSLGLTIFWVVKFHGGFAWRDDPKKQFNLHPVLMVAGFITFSGFSVLLYRICRCCRRIYVKLLHTVFHSLAIPCVAVGFLAVLDSHNLAQPTPIPNFYSLHSWIGLVTMGLFAIQYIVGFFSFLILLCCEGATAGFRASLVPIHASFGLTTFMLAIAACVTGITEKVIFSLGQRYSQLDDEAIIVNTIGISLIGLAIVVGYILQRDEFRYRAHILIRSGDI
ncbi:lysosomal membrane ascorbate-dependent ferrireductase CYB561A3 isoform X2 [Aethina tumida]|uniref:lysosomal membrane ascorbate-dependent ferrireductase CYB561A3 isoform X2 n=1 Tax=Aethina tumida TaxID=116153 RepID=UPI00096B4830|nr:lysosomal membrane ascorbate-dependent ferrireductase CYB561A3 isoform X2 [Aethina tumida]